MVARIRRADGPTYRAECEQIEVTSFSPRPDPNWRLTDHAGHEHDGSRELLIEVQDDPDESPFYVDSDGEEWNAPTHLECRLCGEHITPGSLGPSPFREFVPGAVRYYRDDVEITEAEYRAALGCADGEFEKVDSSVEAPADATTGEVDFEDAITIEQAGDIALLGQDPQVFYDSVDEVGYDLALLTWEAGFNGAAEPSGFTDKEIFDEILSRR